MKKPVLDKLKTKFTDDPVVRMQRAAKHPTVKEFTKMIADACRLQVRMRRWLRHHDRPEDTPGIVNLAIAFSKTDDDINENGLHESLQALRSMDWVILRSIEQIKAYVLGSVFWEISNLTPET
ncbi:MAG: hypothetical protein U0798_17645 [Gemmataceae bacterium]